MSVTSNGSLQPTWFGYVATARDALVLFEACLNGTLHHVPRRPHDRERGQLIKSGCVFIYEENASGIKRWTDGVPWSPSRILGNFLVYRELMKPFPPGEKKRATKKNARQGRATKPGEPYPRNNSDGSPPSPETPGQTNDPSPEAREAERALIGSLVDSYGFKDGGLVKKTMSVNVHGVHHHLVSYYTVEDAKQERLQSIGSDARLTGIEPRHDLVARQSFRAPLDETDDAYADGLGPHPGAYQYPGSSYSRADFMAGNQSIPVSMHVGYNSLPLSSPTFSGGNMQSYAPVSQSYYASSNGLPTSIRHDPYGYSSTNFSSSQRPPLSISTENRRGSLPQSAQYSYRQGPSTPQTARPSLGGVSQSQDANAWDRSTTSTSHGSLYSSTSQPHQPHSAGPYVSHNPQWPILSQPTHNLPRMESAHGWGAATDNGWGLDHTGGARHATYQTATQPNA